MIKYHMESFFKCYRIAFGKLSQEQVQGIEFLMEKMEESKRVDTGFERAYVLATVKWETAGTYQPITEYGSDSYLRSKKYWPFIGRGYVQLTWKSNYEKFGSHLGMDLVGNPKLANDPNIAWKVLEMGMTDTEFGAQDPDFTKYTLEDFVLPNNGYDFFNARKIINPGDKDSYHPIAETAVKFNACLSSCIIAPEDIPDPRL